MQTTTKRTVEAKLKKEITSKVDSPKSKSQDDKLKKTPLSTPRNFVQKSSTADIYGQKKKSANTTQAVKAPKKLPNTSYVSSVSPMKDVLKSSPSSISSVSLRAKSKMVATKKTDAKASKLTAAPKKDFNVTVNSPIVKRKLNMERERSMNELPRQKRDLNNSSSNKESVSSKVDRSSSKIAKVSSNADKSSKAVSERQRTKTRTLDENEVKVLTPEHMDNNAEMYNLTRKLNAKPKAFYVDLDENKTERRKKTQPAKESSDDDVSYEDDFESYESDFDSYHSSSPSDHESHEIVDRNDEDDDGDESQKAELPKETRDEEKMLDSGSFDLRDRSATKSKPALDFITEASEGGDDKRSSLTDEGFQEMSSSSAVSSMKTVHTEVIERPLFIDFTKSKEMKRKKRINDQLRQRARDLLSIISLHEMSYSLFEMKPISYDLYMATFGRSNYTQIAVQTFDDGNSIDVQTEEIEQDSKWTQHPVEFTKNDICIEKKVIEKYRDLKEDFATKFSFLNTVKSNSEEYDMNLNEEYKNNPLRIYFEQKNGVGANEMLPFETYKNKLKYNDYNTQRLGKFLKKIERRVSNVLQTNSGNTETSELKMTRIPFSKGYLTISTKNLKDKNIVFLNNTKILKIYFSDVKSNLIMTVHDKSQNPLHKCLCCLWDISVATQEPLKILAAIDNVGIGSYRGATDGIFVAGLEDCSLHMWDLSEQPTWRDDVASDEKSSDLVDINKAQMSQTELDREWNLKNSQVGVATGKHNPLQICAYTSSAYNMNNGGVTDHIVGLEFIGNSQAIGGQDKKIVGQIMSLQRVGILTIWSIVQEKTKAVPPDIGKAYWSKMKLEKYQTISLLDHIESRINSENGDDKSNFSLNAAKKRLVGRKQEKRTLKRQNSRPKSAISSEFDIDRPVSAASGKNKTVLPVDNGVGWETGVLCFDLKVMNWKNCEYYLVAKNCGEVLCCRRILGAVKVKKLCIANNASSVSCLEVSPHSLPYFLAATDCGTISLCSLSEHRVLLTLDCRNIPSNDNDKTQADSKGRFISSVSNRTHVTSYDNRAKLQITSVSWALVNPCCIVATLLDGATVAWDLTHSDIYASYSSLNKANACCTVDSTLALLTPEGEVQLHKLTNEHKIKEFLNIFEKYVALL